LKAEVRRPKYEKLYKPCRKFRRGFLHFDSAHFVEICTQSVQIQGINKAFIVKDDIELGYLNTMPIWPFDLTY